MVLGSGLRGALADLDADAVEDVRVGFLQRLADERGSPKSTATH